MPSAERKESLGPFGAPSVESIRLQLEKILRSDVFTRSDRMKRFLRFTVEETLRGREDSVKEYSIAVSVFDKPESFDPRLDPIVRVEAGRLRSKLRDYYEAEGAADAILIAFPKRSYVPVFERHQPVLPGSSAPRPNADFGRPAIPRSPSSPEPIRSVAVMPFRDISSGKDQSYFCDGITEEIVNALSRVEGLQIVSRMSTHRFRSEDRDVRQIGLQLNVQSVLEGSVRRSGKRVRIAAHLTNVADGYYLWTDIFDREFDDIFDIQEQISHSIVSALRLRFGDIPGATPRRYGTTNSKAYQLYLRGRYAWNSGTLRSLRRALKFFEKAIAADPKYALAYSGLADCYASLAWLGALNPEAGWGRAAEAARAASEKDSSHGQIHASLGLIRAAYEWNWSETERCFRKAIELNPRYATAHHWYAVFCLVPQSQLDEALAELKIAHELDPASTAVIADLGWVLSSLGQHQSAAKYLEDGLALDPLSHFAHLSLGHALLGQARFKEAVQAFQTAHELSGGLAFTLAALGRCYAKADRRKEALHCLRRLGSLSKRKYVSPVNLALIHEALGEADLALDQLELALKGRCSRLIHLKADSAFESLKSSHRFAALCEGLHLDPPSRPPAGAPALRAGDPVRE